MDIATKVYIKYTEVYARPPQTAQQLLAFSKNIKDIDSIAWKYAQSVMLSPPSLHDNTSNDSGSPLTLKDSVNIKPPIKITIESVLADLSLDNISHQIWRESRKPINMVLLLDVSDSMHDVVTLRDSSKYVVCRYRSAPNVTFTVYDFTQYGVRRSNIEKAKYQCVSILKQLASHDRVAVIAFNDRTTIVQRMRSVKDVNLDELTRKVNALTSTNCTDLQAAHDKAVKLLKQHYRDCGDDEHERYDNKIVIVSDLAPNSVKVRYSIKNHADERSASQSFLVHKK